MLTMSGLSGLSGIIVTEEVEPVEDNILLYSENDSDTFNYLDANNDEIIWE